MALNSSCHKKQIGIWWSWQWCLIMEKVVVRCYTVTCSKHQYINKMTFYQRNIGLRVSLYAGNVGEIAEWWCLKTIFDLWYLNSRSISLFLSRRRERDIERFESVFDFGWRQTMVIKLRLGLIHSKHRHDRIWRSLSGLPYSRWREIRGEDYSWFFGMLGEIEIEDRSESTGRENNKRIVIRMTRGKMVV